ncbi:MAG: DUF2442 domain-containing protein [Bacteroidales bacterium]|nr:DUF2442 domain-containing protein [Bacteroidales bacterium]
MAQRYIEKVWVDDTRVYARTRDGLVASYPFAMWERLNRANQEQRSDYYLSYTGIHWPQIDEDLSFEGMFNYAGLCERTEGENSVCYIDEK